MSTRVNLRESLRQNPQIHVVGIAGAQKTQAPRPPAGARKSDLARQAIAVASEASRVSDAASVGLDLLLNGLGGGGTLHDSGRAGTRPRAETFAGGFVVAN